LYYSPNIIRVIKSGRTRWAGHVAHIGEVRNVYEFHWKARKEQNTWKT